MEAASGQDFPTLLRQEVLQPLAMEHTEAERSGGEAPGRVTFYDNVTPYSMDGRIVASPALDFSSKWASGGILSTVEDVVRLANAHIRPFNRGFLRDETLELLMTPRTRTLGLFSQGLGWGLARDHRGRRARLHFGAGSGGTSFLIVYPDQQVSLAILANLGHARFPMPRLLGVASPFVGDPLAPVAWFLGVAAFGAGMVLLSRRKPDGARPYPWPGRGPRSNPLPPSAMSTSSLAGATEKR
jgi:CubicO group peptidase (beta-lactamase class C family)